MYNDYYYSSPSYSYGGSSTDSSTVLAIVLIVLSLAATICAMIWIMPENKRKNLPKFFQVVADIFNFKHLLIEAVMRFIYVFMTIFTILGGFISIFSSPLSGLLTMLLGPIAVRLSFEMIMMAILLVKNVIQINKKLGGKEDNNAPTFQATPVVRIAQTPPAAPVAPAAPTAPTASEYTFCAQCGTRYDKNQGACPNCGK